MNAETLRPILYSFRRCPYAMRVRLALYYTGLDIEIRDIILRDKPQHMLDVSPKGTVPVLILNDGQVLEESLDIMIWAAQQNDPNNWLNKTDLPLIEINDHNFKAQLDRYKYPTRFPDEDCTKAQQNCDDYFREINARLKQNGQHSGQLGGLTDYAIFPFIRQCANVDTDWFNALPYADLQCWLSAHLGSAIFTKIMRKQPLFIPQT